MCAYCARADGKAAAVKALREGQAVAPAGEDGQLSIAVRATDYASWVQDSPAYEVTYEEVRNPVKCASQLTLNIEAAMLTDSMHLARPCMVAQSCQMRTFVPVC